MDHEGAGGDPTKGVGDIHGRGPRPDGRIDVLGGGAVAPRPVPEGPAVPKRPSTAREIDGERGGISHRRLARRAVDPDDRQCGYRHRKVLGDDERGSEGVAHGHIQFERSGRKVRMSGSGQRGRGPVAERPVETERSPATGPAGVEHLGDPDLGLGGPVPDRAGTEGRDPYPGSVGRDAAELVACEDDQVVAVVAVGRASQGQRARARGRGEESPDSPRELPGIRIRPLIPPGDRVKAPEHHDRVIVGVVDHHRRIPRRGSDGPGDVSPCSVLELPGVVVVGLPVEPESTEQDVGPVPGVPRKHPPRPGGRAQRRGNVRPRAALELPGVVVGDGLRRIGSAEEDHRLTAGVVRHHRPAPRGGGDRWRHVLPREVLELPRDGVAGRGSVRDDGADLRVVDHAVERRGLDGEVGSDVRPRAVRERPGIVERRRSGPPAGGDHNMVGGIVGQRYRPTRGGRARRRNAVPLGSGGEVRLRCLGRLKRSKSARGPRARPCGERCDPADQQNGSHRANPKSGQEQIGPSVKPRTRLPRHRQPSRSVRTRGGPRG